MIRKTFGIEVSSSGVERTRSIHSRPFGHGEKFLHMPVKKCNNLCSGECVRIRQFVCSCAGACAYAGNRLLILGAWLIERQERSEKAQLRRAICSGEIRQAFDMDRKEGN